MLELVISNRKESGDPSHGLEDGRQDTCLYRSLDRSSVHLERSLPWVMGVQFPQRPPRLCFPPEQIQNLSENQRLTTAFTGLYATLSLILGVTPAAPEAEEQSGEWWPERWMQGLTKPVHGKKLAKKKVGTTSQNLFLPASWMGEMTWCHWLSYSCTPKNL